MKNILLQSFILTLLFTLNTNAQSASGITNPTTVKRLDLTNNKIDITTIDFSKFVNIEYLSLKDDHLTVLPKELFLLKKLKTLDLSGNDLKVLPKEFSKLKNLEALYLNDENNMDLPASLDVLAKLPKLKSLFLENDNIRFIPNEMFKLQNLEYLSLRKNELKEIPKNMNSLSHLKSLNLNENNIAPDSIELKNLNFGFKINF
jgi:Leucine-rich repeat (LRR) protein